MDLLLKKNKALQHQLNSKDKKKTTQHVHVRLDVVTTEVGRAEAAAARAKQQVKQKKAQESHQRKEATTANTII
jgi:hypothetical protein